MVGDILAAILYTAFTFMAMMWLQRFVMERLGLISQVPHVHWFQCLECEEWRPYTECGQESAALAVHWETDCTAMETENL